MFLWKTFDLLNIRGGWRIFLNFLVKINYWAYLFGSVLKLIFFWKVHSFTVFKSLFRSLAEPWMSQTTENREVSSANSLILEDKANHLCKSRIVMDLDWTLMNLDELPNLPQSKKLFTRLQLIFVSYFAKSQLKVSINFLILHFEIASKELLHPTLYLRLLRFLERRS